MKLLNLNTVIQKMLIILAMLGCFLYSATVFSFDAKSAVDTQSRQASGWNRWEQLEHNNSAFKPRLNYGAQPRSTEQDSFERILVAQNSDKQFRSKGDVMQEVKRRYDGKVLKISLNKQRAIYNVRILLPSGKVRNITVSARR